MYGTYIQVLQTGHGEHQSTHDSPLNFNLTLYLYIVVHRVGSKFRGEAHA